MRRRVRTTRSSFTLLEALLASVILAMTAGAVVFPFAAGAHNEQVDARRTLALSAAQELMEEALAQPFGDPDGPSQAGPELGETSRALYDNMDDYHGYAEPAGQIVVADGTVLNGPAAVGLSRRARAAYVNPERSLLRLTVEVAYQGDPVITLTRLVYDREHTGDGGEGEDGSADDGDGDDEDGEGEED